MLRIIIIFCLAFFSAQLFAQSTTFIDSSYINNFIYTEFENNANTARLNSRINYSLLQSKFYFTFKNFYNSDVSKLSQNFFRDFDNLKMEALYLKSSKLNFGGGVRSSILSDETITREM